MRPPLGKSKLSDHKPRSSAAPIHGDYGMQIGNGFISDPLEKIVAKVLDEYNIRYLAGHDVPNRLDFYLPDGDVYIEVKQFHSYRISEQCSRAPNVIVLQGIGAVNAFVSLIRLGGY